MRKLIENDFFSAICKDLQTIELKNLFKLFSQSFLKQCGLIFTKGYVLKDN